MGEIMTEYQILNLMYLAFISNAMYFVGMVLFTWLGFRMANNVRQQDNAPLLGKVFTSIFCLFVGLLFFNTSQIGGGILGSYVAQLLEMGAASGDRLAVIADSPAVIGGAIQSAFHAFIVIFQLLLVWLKE